jgi:hypothetical protein
MEAARARTTASVWNVGRRVSILLTSTPAGVGTPISDGGLPWRYHPDGTVAVE